ncbi:PHP domain-containing protein [Candidatus Woesearchaeota archaeon]|nr:PHP domain-containing protein [Candidatus Woesearchaeota archaeon]
MKAYDLHCHTWYSPCSNLNPKLALKLAKKRGLNGIAITDHNEIKAAYQISKLNKDKDFEVVIASELSVNGGHLTALYINEVPKKLDFFSVVDSVRSQGGLLILAHPYDLTRRHFNKEFIFKNKKYFDGIEVFNSREIFHIFNKKAENSRKELNFAAVGGSDSHFSFEVGRTKTFFEDNLYKSIKNKQTFVSGTNLYGLPGHFFTRIHKLLNKF